MPEVSLVEKWSKPGIILLRRYGLTRVSTVITPHVVEEESRTLPELIFIHTPQQREQLKITLKYFSNMLKLHWNNPLDLSASDLKLENNKAKQIEVFQVKFSILLTKGKIQKLFDYNLLK